MYKCVNHGNVRQRRFLGFGPNPHCQGADCLKRLHVVAVCQRHAFVRAVPRVWMPVVRRHNPFALLYLPYHLEGMNVRTQGLPRLFHSYIFLLNPPTAMSNSLVSTCPPRSAFDGSRSSWNLESILASAVELQKGSNNHQSKTNKRSEHGSILSSWTCNAASSGRLFFFFYCEVSACLALSFMGDFEGEGYPSLQHKFNIIPRTYNVIYIYIYTI